jgi:hypothetical protein
VSEASPISLPQLVPIAAAADACGTSKATLYRHASEGHIQLVKVGAKTFVEADELTRYRRASVRPFVPGERVVANAGGHRPPKDRPAAPRQRRNPAKK